MKIAKTHSKLKAPAPLLMVPFREVRHFQPEDSLFYEPIQVRGQQYGWTIPAHRHDGLHQFQLLHQGSAVATLDGEPIEMKAPAALMVAPGVVHGFVYAQDSVGQQVTVPTQSLRAWLGSASNLEMRLRTSILVAQGAAASDLKHCQELFQLLALEFGRTEPGRTEALNAHALVLALWFLRHDGNAHSAAGAPALRDTLVQRYRMLLEQNFRQMRPVQFYADALAISADHLSRTCRSTTGEAALALMHGRVILEARRLLVYTPNPIIDIARDLGFDDPGHFSRFFAKSVGQSPSTYRSAVASGLAGAPDPAKPS